MGRDQLGRLSVLQNILCHCFIEILKELLETKKQNIYCCSNVFGHNFMSCSCHSLGRFALCTVPFYYFVKL